MSVVTNAERLPVPIALSAMSVAAAVAVTFPEGWVLRPVPIAVFLLVAPGLLLIPLVPRDRGRWVFVVPISLSVDVIVSELVVIGRGDLPVTVLIMAGVIFVAGATRAIWLVSRPSEVQVTLVGRSGEPVKVTMSWVDANGDATVDGSSL